MSRYIDAELVSSLFDEEFKETRKLICQGETHLDNLAEGFLEADRVIQKIPTADVVEVVRCKDCIEKRTYPDGTLRCRRTGRNMSAEDYCSRGERRSENEG